MTTTIPRQIERVNFPRGTRIFREGEPGAFAYLIETGKVEISSITHGKQIVISKLGEGDMFGEMALIDNLKRSATAIALEDTDVIALDRSQFESKISTADPVLHMLLRVVLKRFRWALRKALTTESMGMTGELRDTASDHIFDSARDQAILQLRMEQELREALSDGQFELHYQPIVRAADLQVAGFEALIRWRHPRRGLLWPGDFIRATEDSNLIVPIGDWVLQQACLDLARIQNERPTDSVPLFVTVNVSARQIQHLAQKGRLTRMINRAGIRPHNLKLEFTESILIESPELASQMLDDIRESGVKFAIDDFGTGYSSLSYLQRFPLDALKIDRSFVTDMTNNPESLKIVQAIIGLSKVLSLDVIAEGIETPEAMRALTDINCDFLQGYLFSRPVPIGQALKLPQSFCAGAPDSNLQVCQS